MKVPSLRARKAPMRQQVAANAAKLSKSPSDDGRKKDERDQIKASCVKPRTSSSSAAKARVTKPSAAVTVATTRQSVASTRRSSASVGSMETALTAEIGSLTMEKPIEPITTGRSPVGLELGLERSLAIPAAPALALA